MTDHGTHEGRSEVKVEARHHEAAGVALRVGGLSDLHAAFGTVKQEVAARLARDGAGQYERGRAEGAAFERAQHEQVERDCYQNGLAHGQRTALTPAQALALRVAHDWLDPHKETTYGLLEARKMLRDAFPAVFGRGGKVEPVAPVLTDEQAAEIRNAEGMLRAEFYTGTADDLRRAFPSVFAAPATTPVPLGRSNEQIAATLADHRGKPAATPEPETVPESKRQESANGKWRCVCGALLHRDGAGPWFSPCPNCESQHTECLKPKPATVAVPPVLGDGWTTVGSSGALAVQVGSNAQNWRLLVGGEVADPNGHAESLLLWLGRQLQATSGLPWPSLPSGAPVLGDEQETWQPIDTAPRDGTLIRVRQGDWLPGHARWKHGGWRYVEYQGPSRPTHWMPIPEPPRAVPSADPERREP